MRERLAAILVALLLSVAASTVASLAAPNYAAAGVVSRCLASPIYDRAGPGLRNWRAYDPYCDGGGNPGKWWGPWRFTKGGATIDAERHNVQML